MDAEQYLKKNTNMKLDVARAMLYNVEGKDLLRWMEEYHQGETTKMISDFIEEKNRLKDIIKNLIYTIDGEFVSEQLSQQAQSAEEELQLMEIKN